MIDSFMKYYPFFLNSLVSYFGQAVSFCYSYHSIENLAYHLFLSSVISLILTLYSSQIFLTVNYQFRTDLQQIIMSTSRERFFQSINNFFEPIDRKLGPSQREYKPGCDQDKEMFLQCVLSSDCYKQKNSFKYCAQQGVAKQCKAIRYDYYLCKRSMIFWNKSFSQDDPRKA